MASTLNPSPTYVVVDANVLVAIAAREPLTGDIASDEMSRYTDEGCSFMAPALIVSETLYALCRKVESNVLSPIDYERAHIVLTTLLDVIQIPSDFNPVVVATRAHQLRLGYGCKRVTDSIYIALAEETGRSAETVLLTFDRDLEKQAARNAPTVRVHLLETSAPTTSETS